MKRFKLWAVVAALAAGLLPLGATGWGQDLAGLSAFTLDNGLEVVLVNRPGAPVTTVDMWVHTGNIHETAENAGISHFFEHMLFKGSARYPGGFDAAIEGLGGQSNAATSFDWTHYYITVPAEHTPTALEIMADITQRSTFPEDEIEREKQVVLREMGQRSDDPTQFLYWQTYQHFFQVHPYGLPLVGTSESLDGLTRDSFLAYMARYYTPDNMTLVVVGDFDEIDTLVAVRAAFGGMAGQAPQDERIPQEPPLPRTEVVEIERDVSQGYLTFAWPAPAVRQAREVYAMDVLLGVLSNGRASRFYQAIQRPGLVRAVDAGYLTQRDPGMFNVYAEFPYENRAAVEQAILAELRRVRDGDLSAEELERAKTIMLSGTALSAESSGGLAGTLGFYAAVAGDYRFALSYPDGLRSVTVADVVDVARAYVDPDRYLEVVLVPEGRLSEGAATEGAITLDNGLKLVFQEDHQTDVVALQAFVGAGLAAEPPDRAGIAALTQRLLLKGTQTRGEDEIFATIENLGARIGVDVLDDMAHLYLVATADTLDAALPVFLDVLLNPAFEEAEVERAKAEALREIQAGADDNFAVIYDNFKAALYGAHGYGRPALGTPETVQAITREDVAAFYAGHYAPNNLVVTAVGHFQRPALQAALARALGGLPRGAEAAPELQPALAALEAPATVTAEKDSSLAWLVVGYPGPAIGDPDYPAMKLLNAVLGGGSSSRLFQVLRDQQGLAYSTGSFFPSKREDSHLVAYIISLPENAAAAEQGILDILHDIKTNGVPADELERAKNLVLGAYLIDHETALRRAWYVGWYEMLGVGADMDGRYPERIRALTSEDVQRAAERFLNNYVVSALGLMAE